MKLPVRSSLRFSAVYPRRPAELSQFGSMRVFVHSLHLSRALGAEEGMVQI